MELTANAAQPADSAKLGRVRTAKAYNADHQLKTSWIPRAPFMHNSLLSAHLSLLRSAPRRAKVPPPALR
jgi:hypothetical protein